MFPTFHNLTHTCVNNLLRFFISLILRVGVYRLSIFAPIYRLYEWLLWKRIKIKDMPKHLAIILDGNRRFARSRRLSVFIAHQAGAMRLEDFLDWCCELGIEVVTIYAFSLENFRRPPEEVEVLMRLFEEKFNNIITDKRIHGNRIKVRAIGRIHLLPDYVREAIKEAEKATENYDNSQLNIAIGYSGRIELIDAFKEVARKVLGGILSLDEIDEALIDSHLSTAGLPEPDLIIRSSGEERMSGFLLWQSAYSELYFSDVFWPLFRKIDLLRAIRNFQDRERRFGE